MAVCFTLTILLTNLWCSAHLTGRNPVKIRNGRATVIGDVDWYQP
jgi:hypothetical protein